MSGSFTVDTPAAPGPVAVIRVLDGSPGGFFARSGVREVPVGASGVRDLFGLDRALVARPDAGRLLLMTHGGRAVVRGVVSALEDLGYRPARAGEGAFVEAGDAVELAVLDALARAASPLAVPLLLDQPRRWRAHRPGDPLADGTVLGRLLDPPAVAAIGPANIGKSSLLNALAGAPVALAFDRPGTTRDAVGVLVDLGGLVVRWVDTPGLLGPEDEARATAEASRADLVLRCFDAADAAGPPGWPGPSLTVALRADRGGPRCAADVVTSVTAGRGLGELAERVRERLVPGDVLRDPRPWLFWPDAGA